MKKSANKRIYLDYASMAPLDERVEREADTYSVGEFGNAGSVHKEGVSAKKILEESRIKVARILQCRSEEIIFTSGGTESNNLAILGVAENLLDRGIKLSEAHFITTKIEHSSVLECFKHLEKRGAQADYVGVNENGLINPREIKKLLRPNTALISIGLANGEIGVVQPVAKIAKILRDFRSRSSSSLSSLNPIPYTLYPLFHSDASQAARYLNVSPDRLGVDFLTLDGQKIGGPKGVGALFAKRNAPISPITFGGKQQKGLRPGTENIPAIAGFAKALEIASAEMKTESARLAKLRDYFFAEIKKIPNAGARIAINGDLKNRLPNNINISVVGLDAEFAVIQLDEKGIACSTKSACLGVGGESYIVGALGQSSSLLSAKGSEGSRRAKARAQTSLRFTLGRTTVKKDIDYLLKSFLEIVDKN